MEGKAATKPSVIQSPGQMIKEARLRVGLSTTQLADKLGCSDSAIRYWEHDQKSPIAVFSKGLNEVLGIRV